MTPSPTSLFQLARITGDSFTLAFQVAEITGLHLFYNYTSELGQPGPSVNMNQG